jgi:hypothetical protein
MGLFARADLIYFAGFHGEQVVKPSAAKNLREEFLAWQCRIRQIAMRQDGARPSPGMRPRLLDQTGRELSPALTVLIIPRDPAESTAFFRFQVLKTSDPRDLYERALGFLQADYFQQPASFSDQLLAILPEDSEIAPALTAEERCILAFEQFSQVYRLPCAVSALQPGDAARDAAIWHNRLFNPALPETVHVVAFQPDWTSAKAERMRDGRKTVSL